MADRQPEAVSPSLRQSSISRACSIHDDEADHHSYTVKKLYWCVDPEPGHASAI